MPCGQAPSPQQRAGEAASESHVTADAISQQGGDNYALRASSIQPASSLRGSTPAQDILQAHTVPGKSQLDGHHAGVGARLVMAVPDYGTTMTSMASTSCLMTMRDDAPLF